MKSLQGAWRGGSHPLLPKLVLTVVMSVGLVYAGCSAKENVSKGPKEDRSAAITDEKETHEEAPVRESQARPGEAPEAGEAKKEEAKKEASKKPLTRATVERLEPAEVRKLVQSKRALFIIAYDSEAKFAKLALEGAISRAAFRKIIPKTPKNKKLIFYCA